MEKKKIVKHIYEEGSREHVVYWDSLGSHCSESNCELNQFTKKYKKCRKCGNKKPLDKYINCWECDKLGGSND